MNFLDFEKERIDSILNTIFQMNVMEFGGGKLGAVNGMTKSGQLEIVSMQSEEVWTGITYGLSSTMIMEVTFNLLNFVSFSICFFFIRISLGKHFLHLKGFITHVIMKLV